MIRETCPFHADEDQVGVFVSDEVGHRFECDREGHPRPGAYAWLSPPAPPAGMELGGLAEELGLGVELPAVLAQFSGTWVEYGVVEHAYAVAHPEDWARLVDTYGHTAIKESQYTVSAFLGSTLGRLGRNGDIAYHDGPATGRWKYNSRISWWALHPEPNWQQRQSWEGSGEGMSYVPGQVEQ